MAALQLHPDWMGALQLHSDWTTALQLHMDWMSFLQHNCFYLNEGPLGYSSILIGCKQEPITDCDEQMHQHATLQ